VLRIENAALQPPSRRTDDLAEGGIERHRQGSDKHVDAPTLKGSFPTLPLAVFASAPGLAHVVALASQFGRTEVPMDVAHLGDVVAGQAAVVVGRHHR
jgi:hypothetical protein